MKKEEFREDERLTQELAGELADLVIGHVHIGYEQEEWEHLVEQFVKLEVVTLERTINLLAPSGQIQR